jgi:methionyl-tRNA formyltransferase
MSETRVLFAGTPEFALASLEALTNAGLLPLAVLTQPDRPAGRGKRLTASPVKQFALERGIEVLQPATLKQPEAVALVAALEPDILVVAAYGLILPQSVLEIPTTGCLNVHASLLPRWRGAAPIQAAILAGDSETGVSLMAMTAGPDCGPVYVEESIAIGPEETAGELHDRLAALGGELLVRHFDAIVSGALRAQEQDDALVTYAPKISKQDARLDWLEPAEVLHRQVRAYNPVPGAFFMLDDTPVKCWRAGVIARSGAAAPGDVLSAGRDGIVVACGRDALRLDSLQRPGKRPVTAGEFSSAVAMPGRCLG